MRAAKPIVGFLILASISIIFSGNVSALDEGYLDNVEDIPVYSMSEDNITYPDNSGLKIRYVYDENATTETLDEDLEVLVDEYDLIPGGTTEQSSAHDPSPDAPEAQPDKKTFDSVNTFDSFLKLLAVGIVCSLCVLLLLLANRLTKRSNISFFPIIAVAGLAAFSFFAFSSETKASGRDRYVAADDSPTLYESVSSIGGNNNFVVFGDMCWRVAYNDDNGTRLVYYGERSEFGECLADFTNDYADFAFSLRDLKASSGFYTYNDQMVSLQTSRRGIDDNNGTLFNYRESDCYKAFINGDFDDSMYVSGSGSINCRVKASVQYSSDEMTYENGHFYLLNASSHDQFFEGTLYCKTYVNGCNDKKIHFLNGLVDAEDRDELVSRIANSMGFYVCATVNGAKKLDDGRVDCGNSFEVRHHSSFLRFIDNGNFDALSAEKPLDSIVKTRIESWFESRGLNDYVDRLSDDPFCVNTKIKGDGIVGHYHFDGVMWRLSLESELVSNSESGCAKNDSYSVSEENGNGVLKYPVGVFSVSDLEKLQFSSALDRKDIDIVLLPGSIFMLNEQYFSMKCYKYCQSGDYYTLPSLTIKKDIKIADGLGTEVRPFVLEGEYLPEILPHMVTLKISEDALFDGLVDNFSEHAGDYLFDFDDESNTITFDSNRPVSLRLGGYGIKNITPLKYIKNLTFADLGYNDIYMLPKDFPYDRVGLFVGGNHIAELPDSVLDDEDLFQFFQDIEIRYNDPNNISTPPVLRQYIGFLLNTGKLSDVRNGAINVSNFDFIDSLDKGKIMDPSLPSYVWVSAYKLPDPK